MAIIKPFQALRPDPAFASRIADLPYDVMDTEEARVMVKNNPDSFLSIDRAEVNFPEPIDPYDPVVYQKAGEKLQTMIAEGKFITDQEECLYIYRQIMDGRSQTGIVCTTSVDDYLNGVIKKHEHTRPDKEQDRINHVNALNAHSGPILQTYPDSLEITSIITHWVQTKEPIYRFTANDVEQICWKIDDRTTIDRLVELFATIPNLYIADGHHRSAAASQVALQKRKENPNYSGNESFNYFLAVLFPASDLKIMSYNRVVKDLNNLSQEEFLAEVEKSMQITVAPQSPYEPTNRREFGMFLDNTWYRLSAKLKPELVNDPVASLDVAILQDSLLEPLLGIKNPRTDQRIDFIGGIRGVRELERRVKSDMRIAFSLYPTAIEDVINVADAGLVMPPKSTWFEPKLLSGLFIHQI